MSITAKLYNRIWRNSIDPRTGEYTAPSLAFAPIAASYHYTNTIESSSLGALSFGLLSIPAMAATAVTFAFSLAFSSLAWIFTGPIDLIMMCCAPDNKQANDTAPVAASLVSNDAPPTYNEHQQQQWLMTSMQAQPQPQFNFVQIAAQQDLNTGYLTTNFFLQQPQKQQDGLQPEYIDRATLTYRQGTY